MSFIEATKTKKPTRESGVGFLGCPLHANSMGDVRVNLAKLSMLHTVSRWSSFKNQTSILIIPNDLTNAAR